MQSQAVLNNQIDQLADKVFIKNDYILNKLSEVDKQILIDYCLNHIDELEKIVIELIKYYQTFVTDPAFDQALVKKTTQLDLPIQVLEYQMDFIKKKINKIEKWMTDYYSNHDIYLYRNQIVQLKKSQIAIQTLADQLKEQFLQLQYSAKHLGIPTIMEHLTFCLNMLLQHIPTNSANNTIESYLNITKTLAEFWYEEAPTWSEETVDDPSLNHFYALVLFSLSRIDENVPVLERACYLHILDKKLGLMGTQKLQPCEFELSSYCEQHPEHFIKLYTYLFEGEYSFKDGTRVKDHHVFIETMNELDNKNHHYVKYTFALFNFYLSRAYQALSKHEQAEVCREEAKKVFLALAVSSNASAIKTLEKYFSDELKITVMLATHYLKNKDTKGLTFSDEAYKKLKEGKVLEKHRAIDQEFMNPLIFLAECWTKQPQMDDKKHDALQFLKGCAQTNELAYTILSFRANYDLDCAIAFSQALISIYANVIRAVTVDELMMAGDRLKCFTNQNNPEANFHIYLVYKVCRQWANGTEPLLNAAKEKYEPALVELQKLVAEDHPFIYQDKSFSVCDRIARLYLDEINIIDHIDPVIKYLSLDRKFEVQLQLAKMVADDRSIHFKKYNPVDILLKIINDWDSVWFKPRTYRGILIDQSDALNIVLDELQHLAEDKNDFQFSAVLALVKYYYFMPGEHHKVLKFLSIGCELHPLKAIDNMFYMMTHADIMTHLKSDMLFSLYNHLVGNNKYKAKVEYIGNELMRRGDKRMMALEQQEHSQQLSQSESNVRTELAVIRPSIVKSMAAFFQKKDHDASARMIREKKVPIQECLQLTHSNSTFRAYK